MKHNEIEYFTVKCGIDNKEDKLSLKLPYSVHSDFERTVCSGNHHLMSRLADLFLEYKLLEPAKRFAFQELILQNANEMSTLDDLLECMKAVKFCTVFFEE